MTSDSTSSDEARALPWFRPVAVADDLTDRLSLAWAVNTDAAHDLVPDAAVDIVWLPDGSVRVCGPEVTGWTFQVLGGTKAVGVRFKPGHAGPTLGLAMDEIRDQQVVVEDLLGPDGRRLVEELGELGEQAAPEVRIRVIENHIRRWIDENPEDTSVDPVADHVARTLAGDATASVQGLREATDLSERQLLRRCTIAFGYGPATLRRILRLQRFLELAADGRTCAGLADLAHEAGYADQQHLARDTRAIARATPTELVGDVRSVHDVDAGPAT